MTATRGPTAERASAPEWVKERDVDRLTAVLAEADEAFRLSEKKWGVGRLARLVSPETLEAYRRGWWIYRNAIETWDATTLSATVPKMIAALKIMDMEATARGHEPLSVNAWEVALEDGQVFVVCRTLEEAHAICATPDGRQKIVWTMAELARVIPHYNAVSAIKGAFPGAEVKGVVVPGEPVESGVQMNEMTVDDWSRGDNFASEMRGSAIA